MPQHRDFELRFGSNDTCPVGVHRSTAAQGVGLLDSPLPNSLSPPPLPIRGVVGHAIDSCIKSTLTRGQSGEPMHGPHLFIGWPGSSNLV
jgi:hypothetical protein